MSAYRAIVGVCAGVFIIELLRMASVPSLPLPNTGMSAKAIASAPNNSARAIQEAFMGDVAARPKQYLVFETGGGADRFMSSHQASVEREIDDKITSHGVVGYWQGKTLVVLRRATLKHLKSSHTPIGN